jgi:hypothetical protein
MIKKNKKLNDLNTFIKGWYIDKKICDDLIKYYKNNFKDTVKGKTTSGYDPSIKKSIDLMVPLNSPSSEIKNYIKNLNLCAKKYKKIFNPLDNICGKWGLCENLNIQKYQKKEAFFAWHSEKTSNHEITLKRVLAFMTYLNDVKSGGETEWMFQKLKIKPKKGLTIIWPSEWTHIHKGCVSNTEEKYIITGWYSFI